MKKRQIIVTTAVAATAAVSSVLPIYSVAAQANVNTIEKAADYLGVESKELLDAFKRARIEVVEDKIKNGLIDSKAGIELIHKIEDADDFYVLPKV